MNWLLIPKSISNQAFRFLGASTLQALTAAIQKAVLFELADGPELKSISGGAGPELASHCRSVVTETYEVVDTS